MSSCTNCHGPDVQHCSKDCPKNHATPKPIESLDELLQILFEQAVSQGQMNSSLRDNRNPRDKILYEIANRYVKQAKQAIEHLITERERVARRDELEQFSWCVYEGCGDYVTERLASLSTQEETK